MRKRTGFLMLSLAALAACGSDPVSPRPLADTDGPSAARPQEGTGLVLTSFTEGLPIVGNIQIEEVVLTGLTTFAGGLQASGTITGTRVDLPGVTVTEDFTTDVLVSSSGTGRCELVTVDLGPIGTDVFGVVGVDIPTANVSGDASGAIGPLLCALGSVVNGVADAVVGGLVNAIDALLGSGRTPRV